MQTLPYPPETVRYWRTDNGQSEQRVDPEAMRQFVSWAHQGFNTMASSMNNMEAQLAKITPLLDFIDHYHPEVVREYVAWSGVNKRFDRDDTGVATAMADGGAA